MKKVRILIPHYYSPNDGHIIGGVESYIETLSLTLYKYNFDVTIYQYSRPVSNNDFAIKKEEYTIIGVGKAKKSKDLLKYIYANEMPDFENDILIFSTDFMIVKNSFRKSISIQHGIAWDVTSTEKSSYFENILYTLFCAYRAIKKTYKYRYCNHMICVDYNFINWYRTLVKHVNFEYHIIPNYTRIPFMNIDLKPKDDIRIVFARRLEQYRGTRLFCNAVIPILTKYNNVKITIAGNGPDENWLREKLSPYKNVTFDKYNSLESVEFHRNFDIAVVPSLGSEGTSLSLLEAMAAGCSVIATDVGGLTNIIINKFNGLLIRPNEQELVEALEQLIINYEYRIKLASVGQAMAQNVFSYDRWVESWKNVIERV